MLCIFFNICIFNVNFPFPTKPPPSPIIPFKVIHTRHLEAPPALGSQGTPFFCSSSSLACWMYDNTFYSVIWRKSQQSLRYFSFTCNLLSISAVWNTYSFNSIMYPESTHFSPVACHHMPLPLVEFPFLPTSSPLSTEKQKETSLKQSMKLSLPQ